MLNITVGYAFENNVDFLKKFQKLAKFFNGVRFVAFYISKNIKPLLDLLCIRELDLYSNIEFLIITDTIYKDQDVVIFDDQKLVFQGQISEDAVISTIHKITDSKDIAKQLGKEIMCKIETADKNRKDFLLYAKNFIEMYGEIARLLSPIALKHLNVAIYELNKKIQRMHDEEFYSH